MYEYSRHQVDTWLGQLEEGRTGASGWGVVGMNKQLSKMTTLR